MPTVNGHDIEPGCYVAGDWGQYGPDHLADWATEFGWEPVKPSDDPRVLRHFAELLDGAGYGPALRGTLWEWHIEAADEIETWLNDHTSEGFVWHWHDGEFFLSPICDDEEECDDETCAHWC